MADTGFASARPPALNWSARQVPLDDLPARLKNAYLDARALVGKAYAFPTVEPRH